MTTVMESLPETLPTVREVELAALLGRSQRQVQRWATQAGPPPRRLEPVARIAALLRHSWTEEGVVAWFFRPRRDLGGREPVDTDLGLVSMALWQAESSRAGSATSRLRRKPASTPKPSSTTTSRLAGRRGGGCERPDLPASSTPPRHCLARRTWRCSGRGILLRRGAAPRFGRSRPAPLGGGAARRSAASGQARRRPSRRPLGVRTGDPPACRRPIVAIQPPMDRAHI